MTPPDTSLTDALSTPQNAAQARKVGSGKIDVTADGAELNNVVIDHPVANGDWTTVFALFNLDANEFEVVDDTVRMSTWQQSKRTEDGSRDGIQLYAYSARFRRITADRLNPAVISEWRQALKPLSRIKPTTTGSAADAGTYVILIADPQLGKKGTAEAVENWRRGVTRHLEAVRKLGPAVGAIHVGFMGDEHENVVNSYGNQPHTVELNRSRQLELDYDMRVWTLKEVLTTARRRPVTASSVISNHGEWTRNGDKEPVTSQHDNSSTYVGRQVAKLFAELEPHTGQHIDWTFGDDHPGITVRLSGVDCYLSHGYIEKGRGPSIEVKTKSAIERQILGRTEDLGEVALWFMAHYHHFYMQEFEGRTLFGCPAIEAERSSEYMLDQFGVWSPPGVLGLLVGAHEHRGWSHLNVF